MKQVMVFCLLGLLSACVSTTANMPVMKTQTHESPCYTGDIHSIDKPLQPKYSAARIKAQMQLFFASDEGSTMLVRHHVTDVNNQLRWKIEYMDETTADDAITGCVLTDNRGKIVKMEQPFIMNEKMAKDVKESGNLFFYFSFNSFLPQFNSSPVKSGDVLYVFSDLRNYFGSFGDEELKIQIKSSKVQAVLRGWADEGERKVLVADIQGEATWEDQTSFEMDLKVNGYSLIDPETYHVLKSEIKYSVLQWEGEDPFVIKYFAEIK